MIWNDKTIEEAKRFLEENSEKGTKCPCCGATAKIYKRPLSSSMAYALILLYKATTKEREYIHVEDHFKTLDIPSSIRGDFPKLRFWGLIESQKGSKEDGNPENGIYRITERGKEFVKGRLVVPTSIRISRNQFLGFGGDGKVVNIHQALKNKFNYSELMK